MSNQTTPFPDESFWADAYRIALTQGKNFRDAAAVADETIRALRERRQPITQQHREWLLKQAKECYENRREIAKEPQPGFFGGFNPWDWAEPTLAAMRDYDREIARIGLTPHAPAAEPSIPKFTHIDLLMEAIKKMGDGNTRAFPDDMTVGQIIKDSKI